MGEEVSNNDSKKLASLKVELINVGNIIVCISLEEDYFKEESRKYFYFFVSLKQETHKKIMQVHLQSSEN